MTATAQVVALSGDIGVPVHLCDALMQSDADRLRVARETLEFARGLALLRPGAGS